jgi:hypothetical protein
MGNPGNGCVHDDVITWTIDIAGSFWSLIATKISRALEPADAVSCSTDITNPLCNLKAHVACKGRRFKNFVLFSYCEQPLCA